MLKKFLYILTISFCFIASEAYAASQFQIVSRVNDDIITLYDLESRSKLAIITRDIPDTKEARRAIAPQVMQSAIEEKLKIQEITKHKIKVKDEEIADAFRSLAAKNNLKASELKKIIKIKGLDVNILLEQIRADIGWIKLVRAKAARNISISNDEIIKTQELLKSNSSKIKYLISEIYIPANKNKKEAFNLANKLVKEINEVGMFGKYASQFSQSPTAANGGQMGLVIEGQLAQVLENEVKKLEIGKISQPVFYNNGFYILKLQKFFDPKEDIEKSVRYKLSQIIIPKDASLNDRGNIAAEISGFEGDCGDFNNIANRYGLTNSGDMGDILAENMPKKLHSQIKNLKKGEVSKEIEFGNGEGYIMVCEKDIPSQIPKKEIVKARLEQQKLELFVQKYLRDLKRTALIENK